MTKYEQAIYRLISQPDLHMTAEQVFSEIRREYPAISKATVYNNLNRLCSAGLIRRVSIEGSPERYDRAVKHDHLVCSRCGKVSDAVFDDMTDALRDRLGGAFIAYDLKVFWICPDCRNGSGEDIS